MDEHVSRGLAVGDIDNDGRVDLVINDLDGAPQVLHNELATRGNWLIVKLQGKRPTPTPSARSSPSSPASTRQMALVQSGTSYISQNDMRQHFGIGSAAEIDEIAVKWPDGTVSKQQKVKANQVVRIAQRP